MKQAINLDELKQKLQADMREWFPHNPYAIRKTANTIKILIQPMAFNALKDRLHQNGYNMNVIKPIATSNPRG